MAWRRTYDEFGVGSIVPAHDDDYVLVNSRHRTADADVPVRVVTIDQSGAVRQRQTINPDVPEDARRARTDVIRTDAGYAVGTGPWFATLDPEFSVTTTGFAADVEANSTTYLAELPDGIAVASELVWSDRIATRVFGFDSDGNLRWSRTYDEGNNRTLTFLLAGPDGGLVVGGPGGGGPWLASIAADGSERWKTNPDDVPDGVGVDATVAGDDGFVLAGPSSMVRLTTAREIEWQRSYDAFPEASFGKVAPTADGGYVVAVTTGLDRVGIVRTDAQGRLQWSYEYAVVDEGAVYLTDVVEHAPGEYLLVGTRRDSREGLAMLLSGAETPPPTPTPTPTPTPLPLDPDTATPSPTETAASTTTPGFGIGTALAGLAGLAGGWFARRR
ncbi:hypothetical protein BRC81_01585 [Halobacteriales archaeon QS_1_68_20]|nr:MAG: hypothetical protein BRC81_01585 [Halobacteriales archaeon QS_1_68_20]